MYLLFYKYLILNNRVNLPGLGSFFVDYSPAKLDLLNERIASPEWVVSFKQEPVIVDRNFLEFVKNELHTNETEANNNIQQFSELVKQEATNGGVELPGIGRLEPSQQGVLLLKTPEQTNTIALKVEKNKLVDVYEEVEYKKPEHKTDGSIANLDATIEKKESEDYWWVWAIILVIISMAALFYYYI